MLCLEKLALAYARIAYYQAVDVSPNGELRATALPHATKQSQQHTGLKQLMTINRRAQGMDQLLEYLPLIFLKTALLQ